MKATDILKSEHRIIEGVLKALAEAANKLEAGQVLRPGFFLDAVDFIQNFADGCHHRKEEGVLFKAMEANGVPVRGGPLGVMLAEHEQGRAFTRAMRQAAEQWQAGDASARLRLVQNARGYVALLSQHIAKEDNILFPMSERVIPFEQHNQILISFEKVELDETEPGMHERYRDMAQALQDEVCTSEL